MLDPATLWALASKAKVTESARAGIEMVTFIFLRVERDASKAKFWLEPTVLHSSAGFTSAELNVLYRLIASHHSAIVQSWHDYFDP